jgi:hypothetical protein
MERNEKGQLLIVDLYKTLDAAPDVLGKDDKLHKHPSRYNGGWIKTVTGLDKTKMNGYSIEGEFVNGPAWVTPGSIFVDCSKDGSRKNIREHHHLFRINDDGTATILSYACESRTWAIEFWPAIEEALKAVPKVEAQPEPKKIPWPEEEESETDQNPWIAASHRIKMIESLSNDEILAEARRRGLIPEAQKGKGGEDDETNKTGKNFSR